MGRDGKKGLVALALALGVAAVGAVALWPRKAGATYTGGWLAGSSSKVNLAVGDTVEVSIPQGRALHVEDFPGMNVIAAYVSGSTTLKFKALAKGTVKIMIDDLDPNTGNPRANVSPMTLELTVA